MLFLGVKFNAAAGFSFLYNNGVTKQWGQVLNFDDRLNCLIKNQDLTPVFYDPGFSFGFLAIIAVKIFPPRSSINSIFGCDFKALRIPLPSPR